MNNLNVIWFMGDIQMDDTQKRMCILYGAGSTSKSSVAVISRAMAGNNVLTLAPEMMIRDIDKFRSNVLEVASKSACSQLTVCNNVEARPGMCIDMHLAKALTGGNLVDGMNIHTPIMVTMNMLISNHDVR